MANVQTKADYHRRIERRAALFASKPAKRRAIGRGRNVLAAVPSCGQVTMGRPRPPSSRRPRAVETMGTIIVGAGLAPTPALSIWLRLLGMQGGRRRDYGGRNKPGEKS